MLVIGVLITFGSFMAAGPGNAYVVTVGAIVYGMVTLLRGLTVRSDLTRR